MQREDDMEEESAEEEARSVNKLDPVLKAFV